MTDPSKFEFLLNIITPIKQYASITNQYILGFHYLCKENQSLIMEIQTLTPAEEQLMKILWTMDTFYSKDILQHYPEPKPHQNTVSTFLKILTEKQFISTEKEGRIFKYSTSISKNDYRTFLVQKLIDTYYNQSPPELLKALLADKILTTHDLSSNIQVETNIIPIVEKSKTKENELSNYLDQLTNQKKEKKKKKKKKKEI